MQTRMNHKDLFDQLEAFSEKFTFDRFNVYQQFGKVDFKKDIDQAAALVDRLLAAQVEMDASFEAVCAQISRKIGLYYAFCENDHVKAAKYFCNHRTVHDLRENILKIKEEISAEQAPLENFTKKEVEFAESYTLILYGQTHDGTEHDRLIHYLEAHLQEYERLENSGAHSAQRDDIALSKALILDCLAVKYLEIAPPTADTLEKASTYINTAITIQKKYMSSHQLSIAELAYSYYLLSIFLQKQFDIAGAANQANFAILLFEELHRVTGYFNLKEFEPRLHHANLLRELNQKKDSKDALQKIIADQIQFYGSDTHPSIIASYRYLGQIDKQSHDVAEAEIKKITKKQKIFTRITALQKMPTYDWCHHQTAIEYQKNIIKIEELTEKLLADKDLLTPAQKAFVAASIYMLGSFYNYARGIPTKAGEILTSALEITAPGYAAICLQLQIAYQTQFSLAKIKRENTINKTIKLTSDQLTLVEDITSKCNTILNTCEAACKDTENLPIEPEKIKKILLFSHYISALLELQLTEIDAQERQQDHLTTALKYLQSDLQTDSILDLEDDLIVKVKSIYAYILTKMTNPPIDPKPIYEELENFLLRDSELRHPEAVKVFIHYAKYIKNEYQKDKSKTSLLNLMLDKYHKAHNSLIITGMENSRLEKEVTNYIEHLEKKLLHTGSLANYSPGLFTPPLVAQQSPTGIDTTFSLASLSSQPAPRPGE